MAKSRESPKVSVLILHWNNYEDTIECLNSLLLSTYKRAEIIVVDNGSTNNSITEICRFLKEKGIAHLFLNEDQLNMQYPAELNYFVIRLNRNYGFAEGNNIGLKFAFDRGSEYCWLLNNDTVVDPDALTALVNHAQNLKDPGIIGSCLLFYHSPNKIQAMGGKISFLGTSSHLYQGKLLSEVPEVVYPDYVVGASMLIAKGFFKKSDGFDSRLYLYYEDVDLSLKAKKMRFNVCVISKSLVWHKKPGEEATKSPNPISSYYEVRNRCFLARKYRPLGWILVFLSAVLRTYQRRLFGWSSKEDFHYRILALKHFLLGKLGPLEI